MLKGSRGRCEDEERVQCALWRLWGQGAERQGSTAHEEARIQWALGGRGGGGVGGA